MTPATGATGKPMSYLFLDQMEAERRAEARRGLADPADCPHNHKTFRAGEWSCRRCGEAL